MSLLNLKLMIMKSKKFEPEEFRLFELHHPHRRRHL